MLSYPSAAFRASAPRGTVLELWDGKDIPSGLNVGAVNGRLSLSKASLGNQTAIFPDADIEVQGAHEVVQSNWTARNHGLYTAIASATVTDPSTPAAGHEFTTLVRNGTLTTSRGTYSVAGTLVQSVWHSGSWTDYPYPHLNGAWTWTAAQTIDRGSGTGTPPATATGLQLRAADAASLSVVFDGYGASGGLSFISYSQGGTRSSPSATPNAYSFVAYAARGHDGTAFTGTKASFSCQSGSLWSGSSTETKWVWNVTPSGSTSIIVGMEVGGLGLSIPVATSSTSVTTGCGIFAGGIGVAGQTTTAQLATTTTTDSSTGTINALGNPTGFIRLTGAAPDVCGLSNPGTSAARRVVLYCVNATTLSHEAGTASAADRIASDTGANISVAAGKTIELIYDTTSTRWRPVRF